MRLLVVLMLALSLLTPKVALTATLLLGDGYRTVVICSGTELLRVTVGPDGEIVSDTGDEYVASHCVLTHHDVMALQRAWQRADYPQFNQEVRAPVLAIAVVPRWYRQVVSSRGPPLG